MFTENYNSCMFEEICLIEFYGNDNEKKMLEIYVKNQNEHLKDIIEIADSIRGRLINKKQKINVS